jgi:hypothetical protein
MLYDKILSSDPLVLDKKRIRRVAECQLIMGPTVAKNVLDFLIERLKEYEACFGEIQTNEKFRIKERNIYDLKVLMI